MNIEMDKIQNENFLLKQNVSIIPAERNNLEKQDLDTFKDLKEFFKDKSPTKSKRNQESFTPSLHELNVSNLTYQSNFTKKTNNSVLKENTKPLNENREDWLNISMESN